MYLCPYVSSQLVFFFNFFFYPCSTDDTAVFEVVMIRSHQRLFTWAALRGDSTPTRLTHQHSVLLFFQFSPIFRTFHLTLCVAFFSFPFAPTRNRSVPDHLPPVVRLLLRLSLSLASPLPAPGHVPQQSWQSREQMRQCLTVSSAKTSSPESKL